METQIYSYLNTVKGPRIITIFGYATRGVPGLELNGLGKHSKNIKEKMIYLTRTRKLQLPTKRFVICVELNDLDVEVGAGELKWLEFPILLLFWYLAGLIPIKKLEDCLSRGWFNTRGDIYQTQFPPHLESLLSSKLNPVFLKEVKYISCVKESSSNIWIIDPSLLLEHIPDLQFKRDYMDKLSAIPLKASIA